MKISIYEKACLSIAALQACYCHTAAAAELVECLHDYASELAQVAACGHAGSIHYCLSNRLPQEPYLFTTEALQECLVNAGCTVEEAQIEAVWFTKRCEIGLRDGLLGDLRRRKESSSSVSTTAEKTSTTTTPFTTAVAATSSTATTATSSSADTSSTITSDASATATTTATSATSTTSGTSSTSGTSATLATTTSSSSSSSNSCLATSTKSTSVCPVQSTGSQSGETLSCYSTAVASTTCAAGYLCETTDGETLCMEKHNSLDTAGIIIAIVFSGAIGITAFSICYCCCRERHQSSRIALAAEAAAISRQALLDKKQPSIAARNATPLGDAQPLMSQDETGDITSPNRVSRQ